MAKKPPQGKIRGEAKAVRGLVKKSLLDSLKVSKGY
jgi:hypothetical protein